VAFTASAELLAKLREAQALLRHQIPDGALEQVVDRALDALLAQLRRQKHAATATPRPGRRRSERAHSSRLPTSRHIPAAVRRTVWARDGGRCAFVAGDGRRCAAMDFLEFHHVVPYARGGQATADNIELRCRAHNGYEAARQSGQWARDEVREEPEVYALGTVSLDRDGGEAAGARSLNSPRGEFEVHGQLAPGRVRARTAPDPLPGLRFPGVQPVAGQGVQADPLSARLRATPGEPIITMSGDVAQLGEHLVRNEGVGGSNPLVSTSGDAGGTEGVSLRPAWFLRARAGSCHSSPPLGTRSPCS
jgi:5-methylcytosine-specific restriction endonuclease McrA